MKMLAQVLPEGCELISKPSFERNVEKLFCQPDVVETRTARRKEWTQVSEWLPIMSELRSESLASAKQEIE